jgi:hypothetical protein
MGFFLSPFKLKRPPANQILLLVNNIYDRQFANAIADMPIAYARTGSGVSVQDHIVPLGRHTVHKFPVPEYRLRR